MPSTFTGADIRALRAHLGVTRVELARVLGYAPSTIKAWEIGRRAVPVGAHRKLVTLTYQAERLQAALSRCLAAVRAS